MSFARSSFIRLVLQVNPAVFVGDAAADDFVIVVV
jgi:hypothetical protein